MSAPARVQLRGVAELERTLTKAGKSITDMPGAQTKASRVVSQDALSRVPRVSGALASTITPGIDTARAYVEAGSFAVPYAGVINYGWPARNISAQPFLTDALEGTERQWLPYYEDNLQKILDTVRGA